MDRIDLDVIIKEIKSRGLTAYEISKHTPLSEDGINKILSGASEKPRKSTLLILHEYLFKKEDKKENPPVSMEDLLTDKILERLVPVMDQYADDVIAMLDALYRAIGLTGLTVHLNSVGSGDDRAPGSG